MKNHHPARADHRHREDRQDPADELSLDILIFLQSEPPASGEPREYYARALAPRRSKLTFAG